MINKKECIEILNKTIKNQVLDNKVFDLIFEYLENIGKNPQTIEIFQQNPHLMNNILPDLIDYYCIKYEIIKIIKNDKIILFYE